MFTNGNPCFFPKFASGFNQQVKFIKMVDVDTGIVLMAMIKSSSDLSGPLKRICEPFTPI
jgi:hypothetical protein